MAKTHSNIAMMEDSSNSNDYNNYLMVYTAAEILQF
jgi:hypothetical protein